jgi:flavin-dependent dehydrogenase
VRRTAALIAGGGPAGAAAAILLARGGATPLLIERQAEPHDIVCGGFLSWDALAMLGGLGVDAAALGARPIDRLRLVLGERSVERPLPRRAAGLSRRRLDTALLDAATKAGVAVERGIAIRRAERLTLHLADGSAIEGESLFLATGKHDLRGAGRRGRGGAIGLRTRLEPGAKTAEALAGVIELHLFPGGYAGLLLQEDGSLNFCLSASAARLTEAGGIPDRLIERLCSEAPLLGRRLETLVSLSSQGEGLWRGDNWAAVSNIPYGWRADSTEPGLFRLGDQAAVIASLAGDGIAIALMTGGMAARCWLEQGATGALAYQRRLALVARRPLAVAAGLRALAEHAPLGAPLLHLAARIPGVAALAARLTRIGFDRGY